MADLSGRFGSTCQPRLPRRHHGAGDEVRYRGRPCRLDRFHANRPRQFLGHPSGEGAARQSGIVAAPTTSLPEQLGGQRNWAYRYCWLRDATLTLMALAAAGYREEARAWRAWLQRSVAGSPNQLQIMYGLSGERQLTEWECRGSLATRVPRPCASATPLPVNSSS